MNKKLFYTIGFILALITFANNPANAIITIAQTNEPIKVSTEVTSEEKSDEERAIKRVSLRERLQRSPETQLNNFYKKFNKYSEKNNIKKLKEMYSDSYINNDGIDKATIFNMMDEASSAYKNVDYTTEIKSIKAAGNYATVEAVETAIGETTKSYPNLPGEGSVSSKIVYTDYLKKEAGKWKIIGTDIREEYVELKYGRAKLMTTEVSGPNCVPENSEYDVSVKINTTSEDFVVGSISNEKIKYPQDQPKDVLRTMKYDEISRILKANTDGYNEYATISLAISQAEVEPEAIVINMQGIAILMHRVNVISAKPVIKETTKE